MPAITLLVENSGSRSTSSAIAFGMIRMEETDVMLRFQAFANSEKCHEIIGKMKAIVRADFPIPCN